MSFREELKENGVIRNLGKKYYVLSAFLNDARNFSKYFCESAERKGDYRYSIMLTVHSLEKGMCMPNPRMFGKEKVERLLQMLNDCTSTDSFEYELGVSALSSWVEFVKEHGWDAPDTLNKCCAFLNKKEIKYKAGWKKYTPCISDDNCMGFENVIVSRHSVRDFQDRELKFEDIELALKCFVETPTACNRQMCRLIQIKDKENKELLDKMIIGLPGFNKPNIQYFIVTYDLAAFVYSGERQQGLFNAGLCTMNFVNGLHAKGIGSCCLQWSNKDGEDAKVRGKLGLSESERIAVVIAAGYYLDSYRIPCSVRRNVSEVIQYK